MNVPNALTVAGRQFLLDNGRQVNVTNNTRIRKVSTVRYVESNAIDDQLEFDNRFQGACVGFNIAHSDTTFRDHWRTLLKAPATTFQNTTSNPGLGYFMNTGLTSGLQSVPLANPVWITNLKQHLFDCYPNYANQTLAACTGVIPFTSLSTPELGQITGESVNVGSVDTSYVVGDIVRSEYKHRITAPVGVDKIAWVGQSEGSTVDLLTDVSTIDFQRGFFSHTYLYTVQGKTKFKYFDYLPEHETNLTNNEFAGRS